MIRASCSRLSFKLPPLPYAADALKPYISPETLDYHHGKHHAAYVTKLNELICGDSKLEKLSLEQLITSQRGIIFNQAAQSWNHTFYWKCMKPGGGGDPKGPIAEKIVTDFGSVEKFKESMSTCAAGHFGSGWAWAVQNPETGKIEVAGGHDADNPLKDGKIPLLTIDVWEHAYYIDYRNLRPKYISSFWNVVNWEFMNQNLKE